MELKEKLVTLRKKKGLSQLELAEMIKVSRQAVSRWEIGSAIPSTNNLKYLSGLYDVSLDYLLNDSMAEPTDSGSVAEAIIEEKVGNEERKRKFALMLMGIGVVLAILLFVVFFEKEPQRPVPMNNIEGREVDVVSENDFELEW